MKISPLLLGKLGVAYEAYLGSLGISTRSFVLKGEPMDVADLSVLQSLGAVGSSRPVNMRALKSSAELMKQSSKRLLALTPAKQEIGNK